MKYFLWVMPFTNGQDDMYHVRNKQANFQQQQRLGHLSVFDAVGVLAILECFGVVKQLLF